MFIIEGAPSKSALFVNGYDWWICSRLPIAPKTQWICFRERAGSNDIHSVLSSHVDKAHNEYLHIAVTTGIPSLIVYCLFITQILWQSLPKVRKNCLYLPYIASVLGYLCQAFFNISVVSVAYIFWVFLGFICSYEN